MLDNAKQRGAKLKPNLFKLEEFTRNGSDPQFQTFDEVGSFNWVLAPGKIKPGFTSATLPLLKVLSLTVG